MNNIALETKLLESIQPSDVKQLEQEMARRQFKYFIKEFTIEPPPVFHHEYIIEKLQQVVDGKIKRLMIFAPPRSAKSYYTSIMLPAYWIGRNKDRSIICASHNQDRAEKWSKKVRKIVGHPKFKQIYGTTLDPKSQAAGYWNTIDGGEYQAIGAGSGVHGSRGDLILIDDPFGKVEDAYSANNREKLWEWFATDILTRLEPNSAIIIICTRFHEEDIPGRILAMEDVEDWTVISLPAIAEDNDQLGRKVGEVLWPDQWPLERLNTQRRYMSPTAWASLYQQRPAPEEGALFQKDWIKYYGPGTDIKLPKDLTYYVADDLAVTPSDGDYTVMGVFGIDKTDRRYLVDWWRGQVTPDVWIKVMAKFIKKYNIIQWGQEKGPILKSTEPFIRKMFRDKKINVYRKAYPSTGDKVARCGSILGWMSEYGIYLPKDAPWVPALVQELLTFPAAKYDDQVDVFSLFGRMLNKQRHPSKAKKKKVKGKFNLNQYTYDELFAANKADNQIVNAKGGFR